MSENSSSDTSEDQTPLLSPKKQSKSHNTPKFTLQTSPRSLSNLQKIQKMNFHNRIFRKMGQGSLRGSIITWLRMTMGIGIFAIPYFMIKLGGLVGVFFIFLTGIVNYKTFLYIFQASEFTQINNYPDIVGELLGLRMYKVFRVTMFVEFVSIILLYTLASWNLFEFFCYYLGFFKDEWVLNFQTLRFDEYNPELFLMRVIFFFCVFWITFKNLLKKTMEGTRFISLCFIISLFSLILYIIIQAPIFRNHYKSLNLLKTSPISKPLNLNWIESFFAFLLTYNIQINALDLKKELLHPTLKRIKKVVRYSISIEIIGGILLGIAGYFSLGDNFTPSLILLRKPILPGGVMELIMRILLLLFFIFLIAGLPTFNVPLKNFIIQMSGIQRLSRQQYYVISILPFFLIYLVSIFIPYIIVIINLFGLTIYNIDAYLIPFLLKYRMMKIEGKRYWSYFYLFLFFLFLGLCILGTIYNFLHFEH